MVKDLPKKMSPSTGNQKGRPILLFLLIAAFINFCAYPAYAQSGVIKGKVAGENGDGLPGVTVLIKGTSVGTATDATGNFTLDAPANAQTIVVSFIGYVTQEIAINNRTVINVSLLPDAKALEEVVVVGYGEQKRGSVTGSIASISSKELTDVPASTVSQALIGKVAGVTTRVANGRPGAVANLQIRNMGEPLFVIDGIQSGNEQFNNLGPDDIESISILKDAAAAIYGLRAANGVVLVTTKKGGLNQENKVNVNTYYGWQSWTRFPEPASAADYVRARAEADMNQYGTSAWTAAEVEKWRAGTEPGYQGFDWTSWIDRSAPQRYVNVNTTGGAKKTNYFFSISHLSQDAVFGPAFGKYNFNRSNIQSNIETRIGERIKVGLRMNGKIENDVTPGVPGTDDYFNALQGVFRNLPTESPYANNNPLYPATNSNYATNYAVFSLSGDHEDLRRTLQVNLDLEYKLPVKGLTLTGMYAYFFNNNLSDTFEKTYNTFTYNAATDSYQVTGGQKNPYRDRRNQHIADNIFRSQLNYNGKFGGHQVSALLGVEAQDRLDKNFFIHTVPATNYIRLINQVAEVSSLSDAISESARAGYIFRANYDFKEKYLLEVAGRYDGSWLFPPGHRWGLFPSVSLGWRVTEEGFLRNSGIVNVLNDFKIRASYGQLGGEPSTLNPYDYVAGYNWNAGNAMLDGDLITGAVSRGMVVETMSWVTAHMSNVGFDFTLWNGRLSGSMDAFYRKRTGLADTRNDVLIPTEVALDLPPENLGADSHMGIEGALTHRHQVGKLNYSVGINATLARQKNLYTYNPRFGNSWDRYRNSTEGRWTNINWGYEYIGQFKSEEEIANYPVDIDGQNNTTLLPGDLIYKDQNNDGVITALDERPNGYGGQGQNPYLAYGLNASVGYKGLDLSVSLAGATLQSRGRANEVKVPFQNDANSPDYLLNDRWHREDIFNLDSPWVPGTYPAIRSSITAAPSNNYASDFWFRNIAYLRLRNLQLGYTVPSTFTNRLSISKARLYLNGANLFSLDNMRSMGLDPETQTNTGLDYPSHRVINVGANITF
jgi:TonB-linked SusC/RagA family outer membrane protein